MISQLLDKSYILNLDPVLIEPNQGNQPLKFERKDLAERLEILVVLFICQTLTFQCYLKDLKRFTGD